MNYYPHHIGDFNNATRHLTRIERSIYRDLIELYYDKEVPLIDNNDILCRRVLAHTDEEKEAVNLILNEFFTLEGNKWIHTRVEREIAVYQSRATSARNNGKKGGRPKKPTKTQPVILANPDITQPKANHNQEPITSNQVKEKNIIPPPTSLVKKYIIDNQMSVDANHFMDVYDSRGWKVGNNKMKDWQATLRNFARNDKNWANQNNKHEPKSYEAFPS